MRLLIFRRKKAARRLQRTTHQTRKGVRKVINVETYTLYETHAVMVQYNHLAV